jgi:RNA ligase
MIFSIWNERNRCLSWDETLTWAKLLGLETVPVLYRGVWDEKLVRRWDVGPADKRREGYVVRPTRESGFAEFRRVVGKYVRAGHTQGSHGWKRQRLTPNELA